ncbi:MAG: hypothetical protein PHI63_00495 [Patescibacteria group bacterium]|nr:hypothetical protein [Patescibacteria group bacterium]
MNTTNKIVTVLVVAAIAVATMVIALNIQNGPAMQPQPSPTPTASVTPISSPTPTPATGVEYRNTEYGFSFPLPESWRGHTIVEETWQGATSTDSGEKVVEHGPQLSIRHPLWTDENPRQDIPIMIFTLAQWDALQQDKFHIGAAPIGPSELGRNATYVFALPARYNYAYPTGYEEVDQILQSKPLHAF